MSLFNAVLPQKSAMQYAVLYDTSGVRRPLLHTILRGGVGFAVSKGSESVPRTTLTLRSTILIMWLAALIAILTTGRIFIDLLVNE